MRITQAEITSHFSLPREHYRIYPLLLAAADRHAELGLAELVNDSVMLPISRALVEEAHILQFKHDYDTFGLREAIIYLADYEFHRESRRIIAEIVSKYEYVVATVDQIQTSLYNSPDPSVQELLSVLELKASEQSNIALQSRRMAETRPSEGEEADEVEQLRLNPPDFTFNSLQLDHMQFVGGWPLPMSSSVAKRAAEWITWHFLDGAPSLNELPFRVAEMLRESGIRPLGRTGRSVLSEVADAYNAGAYGDDWNEATCDGCFVEFRVNPFDEATLAYVLERSSWLCPECTGAQK